jgi:hypothetical protein
MVTGRVILQFLAALILPQVLLGSLAGMIDGLYRAYQKWGAPVFLFVAGLNFLSGFLSPASRPVQMAVGFVFLLLGMGTPRPSTNRLIG